MILLTVVFSSVLFTSVTEACPVMCTCSQSNTCRGTDVNCSSRGLTSVPTGIPSETCSLDLSSNQMAKVDNNVFSGLVSLRNLNLSYNQISRVNNETFNGINALQYLYLDYNQLSKIDNKTFVKLRNLKGLSLSSNQITRIDKDTFAGLSNVQSLILDSNRITGVDDESFSFNGMIFIQSLDLRNNELRTMDNKTFVGLKGNLKSLSIEGNPFHCDCVLSGFVKSMIKFVNQSDAKCATPEDLSGRYLKGMSSMECPPPPQTSNTVWTTGTTTDVRTKDQHTSLSSTWTTESEFDFTTTQSSKYRDTTSFVFSTIEFSTSGFTTAPANKSQNGNDNSFNVITVASLVVNGVFLLLLLILLCVIRKMLRNKRNQTSRYVNFEQVGKDCNEGGYTQPQIVGPDGYLEPNNYTRHARETAFARNTNVSSNSYAEIIE